MENGTKRYDLDLATRTMRFAMDTRAFLKMVPLTVYNRDDVMQLIRSSGAIGANYLEGNDALGKRDFIMRLKISRKESKETEYWLKVLSDSLQKQELRERQQYLLREVVELRNILSAIIRKQEIPPART